MAYLVGHFSDFWILLWTQVAGMWLGTLWIWTHTELSFLRSSKSWSSFQGAFPLLQARDTFLHLYECICYHGNETITLFQGRRGKKVRRAPFPESSLPISSVSPLLIRTQLFDADFLPSSILLFTCQSCLLSPSQSAYLKMFMDSALATAFYTFHNQFSHSIFRVIDD